MTADDLQIVNYCHKNCTPLLNIMRLPKDEAFALAYEMAARNKETTAFYRFADFENYYPRRLKTDRLLYDRFKELGGKPVQRHPLSFVLQGSDFLGDWFDCGIVTKIPLNRIASEHISFTYGDSMTVLKNSGGLTVLTKDMLLKAITDFDGTVEEFLADVAERYHYIEAQVWDEIDPAEIFNTKMEDNMHYSGTEPFETKRLICRPFTLEDCGDMFKNWVVDPNIQQEYGEPVYETVPQVRELLEKYIKGYKNPDFYRWAIVEKSCGENIGQIAFCRVYPDCRTAEIEYCIGKRFWGRGYAGEALAGLIDFTFKNTDIIRLEAYHRVENTKSGRVLEKSPMYVTDTVERFARENISPHGEVCYRIDKDKYENS